MNKNTKNIIPEEIDDKTQFYEFIQIRCEEITTNLSKSVESISQLKSHIQSIHNIIPQTSHKNSMSNLLSLTKTYQTYIIDQIKEISSWYKTLSINLDSNLILETIEYSNQNEINENQQQKKIELNRYSAFSNFCSKTESILPYKQSEEFVNMSNKLIKEFKDDCELNKNYKNSNLNELLLKENVKNDIPIGMNRLLNVIYFSKEDKKDIFKDPEIDNKNQIEILFSNLRSLDYSSIDISLLSLLMKKYLKEMEIPLWPEDYLQPTIKIMESEDIELVIEKYKSFIQNFPIESRIFIQKLLLLSKNVIQHSSDKEFNDQMISSLIAPSIMRKRGMQQTSIAVIAPVLSNSFKFLMQHYDKIFEEYPIEEFIENDPNCFGYFDSIFTIKKKSDRKMSNVSLFIDPRVLRKVRGKNKENK